MNELEIFKNEEFGEIRTIVIDSEPWFVGKDIAEVLGYVKTRNAINNHVDEEDKKDAPIQGSLGGTQNMTIINESGLYSLIISSKLPRAKEFKHWITSEILPTIRKTGGYVNNDDLFINTYLPFADESTTLLFKTTLQTIKNQNEIIKQQKEEIEYKESVIINLVDDVTLAEKRQILCRVVRKGGKNYALRWNALYKEFENKYHINLKLKLDRYNESHKPKMKNKVDYIENIMGKLPELYEIATKLYENDVKILVEEIYELNNIRKGGKLN